MHYALRPFLIPSAANRKDTFPAVRWRMWSDSAVLNLSLMPLHTGQGHGNNSCCVSSSLGRKKNAADMSRTKGDGRRKTSENRGGDDRGRDGWVECKRQWGISVCVSACQESAPPAISNAILNLWFLVFLQVSAFLSRKKKINTYSELKNRYTAHDLHIRQITQSSHKRCSEISP